MADKTSTTLVPITFAAGEQPPADKLTAITAQLRAGVGKMESLLGDPHGEGFPYASALSTQLSPAWGRSVSSNAVLTDTGLAPASEKRLDIANVARLIGPASNLSPKMQSGASQITESIPSGTRSYQLKYKPEDPNGANTPTITGSDWTTYKTGGILTASADWHVSDRGYVTSRTALTGTRSITYTTDPSKYGNGAAYQNANFNVIPTPNQINSTGTGVTVAAISGGKHRVTFPTISHQQSNKALDTVELGAPDFNYGLTYTLPQIIQTLSAGDVIPSGFVVLYNHTTSVSYTDAQCEYVSPNEIDVSGIDLTTELGAGNVFYVITVGTDITTSIDDLRNKWSEHTHDGTFGEQPIKAYDVVGWNETAGEFLPSSIDDNPAPQYLRRTGKQTDNQSYNDDNMMIGDIGFGVSGAAKGSAQSSAGETHKLWFGNDSWNVYRNSNGHVESNTGSTGAVPNYWLMKHGLKVDTDSNSSDFRYPNTALETNVSSGGNIGVEYGSFWSNGAVLGPINNSLVGTQGPIPVWEIDSDGVSPTGGPSFETGVASVTNSNGWVSPKFQVIHYARRVANSDAEVTITTGNVPGGDRNTSTYAEVKIQLPHYLRTATHWSHTADASQAHTAVMGATLLVRSEGSASSGKFHAAGSGADSLYDIINASGSSSHSHHIEYTTASQEVVSFCILDNEVIIHLAESGDFQIGSTYWNATNNKLAIKLTLFVAAPGQHLS